MNKSLLFSLFNSERISPLSDHRITGDDYPFIKENYDMKRYFV